MVSVDVSDRNASLCNHEAQTDAPMISPRHQHQLTCMQKQEHSRQQARECTSNWRRCPKNAKLSHAIYALLSILNFVTHTKLLQELPTSNALSMQRARIHGRTLSQHDTFIESHQNLSQSRRYASSSSSFPLFSTTSEEQSTTTKKKFYPDTKPFNHDIARTLFAPLFFSMSMRQYQNNDENGGENQSTRHHYQRPSPFEDPSSAQTAERMLRRMMENRYRSDGRTVCPDNRTFNLVAGAFGRLKCGNAGKSSGYSSDQEKDYTIITWEEEPSSNPHFQDSNNSREEDDNGKYQMTSTDKLQQLLQIQLRLCQHEGWPAENMPSAHMYNRILKRLAWQSGNLRSRRLDNEISDAEQALLWLKFMKAQHSEMGQPNAKTYSHVIAALSAYRYRVPYQSGSTTSELVDAPVMSSYTPIETLAEKLDIDMGEIDTPPTNSSPEWFLNEAELLLSVLEDEYKTLQTETTEVSHGWSKGELKQALAGAYKCLLEGWGRYAVKGSSMDSDESTRNEGSGDWANKALLKSREQAIMRAHELLGRLEELTTTERKTKPLASVSATSIVPASCYSSVILALSISCFNKKTAANDAEDVLRRLLSQYGADGDEANEQALQSKFFNPGYVATAFSGCIAAHARKRDAPNAERVLNQMLELYDEEILGLDFVPEVRAFGSCIALWKGYNGGKQRNTDGRREYPSLQQCIHNADRAEAILSELEGVAQVETEKGYNFQLHATPYNIAIHTRVQTIVRNKGPSYKNDDYDYREENEEIILHAQSILDHMEFEMGVNPDPYTYSILLHAWCQESRPGHEAAADHAEELLRRRIEDVDIAQLYGDDDDAKNARKDAEPDIWPNVKHYTSVLKAHAKTKSPGGAKKALSLLSEMERRFYHADAVDEDDRIYDNANTDYHVDEKVVAKPDLFCYAIVMDAFANSRLPEASEIALRLMMAVETKYDAGDDTMKPNTRIYTAAILSLVHSPYSGKDDEEKKSGKPMNNAQRAWSILERMKMNGAPPNSYTYNYIINTAAQTGGDAEDAQISFQIALRAFQELRTASGVAPVNGCVVDPCHPDSFTFAFMMKACTNLLPEGKLRTKVISKTFQDCCKSGYLNDAVLDRLWQGVSKETFYELLDQRPSYSSGKRNVYRNQSPIGANDLPESWSRCCNSVRSRGRDWR